MLLFDIGANIGRYARAQIATGKWDEIVCVDPCRAVAPRLQMLASQYKAKPKVTFVPMAVSDVSGQQLTFNETELPVFSSASREWIEGSRISKCDGSGIVSTYKVRTIRIDRLIDRFGVPDLLKVDVETLEEQALKGLTRKVPLLCFEFAVEYGDSVQRILERLHTELGFTEMHVQFTDTYTYVPPADKWWPITQFNKKQLSNATEEIDVSSWGMVWVR